MQVGLFGLCAMLLMVGLANIVMNRARLADTEAAQGVTAPDAGMATGKPAGDPLADIGVVPGANSSGKPDDQPTP